MSDDQPGEPPILNYEKPHIASAMVRMPVVLFALFLIVGILVAAPAHLRFFPPRESLSGTSFDWSAAYEFVPMSFISFIVVLTSCLYTDRYVWRDNAALIASIAGVAEAFVWGAAMLLIDRLNLSTWVFVAAIGVVLVIVPALVVRHGLLTEPKDARAVTDAH